MVLNLSASLQRLLLRLPGASISPPLHIQGLRVSCSVTFAQRFRSALFLFREGLSVVTGVSTGFDVSQVREQQETVRQHVSVVTVGSVELFLACDTLI